MKKTMRVTLEIDVADLSRQELKEKAEEASFGMEEIVRPSDLPGLRELSADEIADCVVEYLNGFDQMEMWAGSNMYVRLAGVRTRGPVKWQSP